MMTDKQKLLGEVAKEIVATNGGPLAGPGLNAVPGEGNPDADIMFIGESPGFHENEERRPFVGQAGKLLRKTLAANGLAENEVYITNIIKFRPPENRDPTSEEIEFFRPFLDRQIEIIAPKIIVTLGRYSLYKFLSPTSSISKIHGQPRTINWEGRSVTIYPMFHPAAALRAGEVMDEFLADFTKLKDLINKPVEPPKPEFNVPEDDSEQLKLV